MICVRLDGGLGNQLFQYAAGRALALKHKTGLVLDTSTLLKRSRGVTPRVPELQHFKHSAQWLAKDESIFLPWLHRIPYVSRWISPWFTYVENGSGYNKEFFELSDNTYLVGYWQSYRYFSDIARQLMCDFDLAEPLSNGNLLRIEKILSCQSVAVHVRRGDYVSLQSAAAWHGVQPIDYYLSAFDIVRNKIESPHFFVFSDDISWCKENLPLNNSDATFVGDNAGDSSWQDLILMSKCKNHIIANSSFSWWGAWMADQLYGEGRVVIAPNAWFTSLRADTADRFPSHWCML